MKTYSVILPAYNEEGAIARAIEEVDKVFRALGEPFETLVVDDGSTDQTAAVVEGLLPRLPALRLLRHTVNQGKGMAVKTGVMAAEGETILFLDCDLAVHPSEAEAFVKALNQAEVVIGSRRVQGAQVVDPQPRYRIVLGVLFNRMVQYVLGMQYEDTQCGFKVMTRKAAQEIFRDLRTQGWAFDVELLLRARQAGFRVVERPVTWRHGRASRVRLRDTFQTLRDLAWLRWTLASPQARGRALVAALVATAFVLPAFILPSSNNAYQGIYTSASSDEAYYIASVREVSEGHPWRRNTYLAEEKKGPTTQVQWVEVPLGGLFRLWPGSVGGFLFAVKWLGIFAAAWLLFRWLAQVRPDLPRPWRIAAGVGFLVLPAFLGPDLFSRTLNALQGTGPWTEFLNAVRFVNPVISAPLLVLSFITLDRLARTSRVREAVWHGILLAILGWSYAFFWLFALCATGLLVLLLLLRRTWRHAGHALLAMAIGGVPVLPLVWSFVSQRGQTGETVVTSYTFLTSHAPIIEWSIIAAVVLFAAGEWLRRRSTQAPLDGSVTLWIVAATTLLAVNHQIITGLSVQPHHFYFQTNLPIASLLIVLTAGTISLLRLKKRTATAVGVAACILLGWMGMGVQVATVRNVQAGYTDLQRFAAAFQELNRYPTPFVVLADARASELIPVYTGADVFFAQHAAVHASTSLERRRFAVHLDAWLRGIRNAEDARTFFTEDRNRIGLWLFEGQYYRQRCGSYGCFPDEQFEALARGYTDFLVYTPEERFQHYRIDAVLWDERMHPEWQLEQYAFLQKTWSGDQVSLWRMAF